MQPEIISQSAWSRIHCSDLTLLLLKRKRKIRRVTVKRQVDAAFLKIIGKFLERHIEINETRLHELLLFCNTW